MPRKHVVAWRYNSTQSYPRYWMQVSGLLHATDTYHENTHSISGSVVLRADLHVVDNRQISCPCREMNS